MLWNLLFNAQINAGPILIDSNEYTQKVKLESDILHCWDDQGKLNFKPFFISSTDIGAKYVVSNGWLTVSTLTTPSGCFENIPAQYFSNSFFGITYVISRFPDKTAWMQSQGLR